MIHHKNVCRHISNTLFNSQPSVVTMNAGEHGFTFSAFFDSHAKYSLFIARDTILCFWRKSLNFLRFNTVSVPQKMRASKRNLRFHFGLFLFLSWRYRCNETCRKMEKGKCLALNLNFRMCVWVISDWHQTPSIKQTCEIFCKPQISFP